MDTNMDHNGLPSSEELQRLANEYFKSPPTSGLGISPQEFSNPSVIPDLAHPSHMMDINNAALNMDDFPVHSEGKTPWTTIERAGHSGISENPTYNHVTKSVAGSGASPSLLANQKTFSIEDPQTSLVDPHFKDGKIPQSVAGSGVSPSVIKGVNTPSLKDDSWEAGLKAVLNEMISHVPSSQLPFGGTTGLSETVFYFLSGTKQFHSG